MVAAATDGMLTLEKLEAMTCVCSVGLDMIVMPGDTTAETILERLWPMKRQSEWSTQRQQR